MIAALFGLTRLPQWARNVIDALAGLLVIAIIAGAWLRIHDGSVIDKHEAKVTQHVNAKASEASGAASITVIQSKQEVEQSNANARTAAAGSNDPLRAGLDSLRHDNPPRPAAH